MLFKAVKITMQVSLFGTIVGAIVSILSVAFVFGVKEISILREAVSSCSLTILGICFSVSPLIFLLISALLIIIVKRTMNISRYHGPADVILSAHSPNEKLDPKTGFLSTFSAFVSASGGASVGQYGPLVHLGGTIGSLINFRSSNLLTKDTFIGCGVAAAISAGFNSPIGGIIFAHEAILRHFSFKAIAPIAVSSVVSATLTNKFFPSGILFQSATTGISMLPSVSLSLILGPVCAIIAVMFMRSLLFLQRESARFSENEIIRIIFAAISVGLIGGLVPEVLGLGGTTISEILDNKFSVQFLIIILLLKLLVTVICLGMGFFGGVYSPALVLGAAIGGAFTYFGNFLGITNLGDTLIFAAMAALSASVIGAPIASIVIIFELTHSYDLAFVAIICVAGSCLISSLMFGHSFFDKQLINRDFKISRGRTDILLSEYNVSSLLGKNSFLQFYVGSTRADVLKMFKENPDHTEAYLVDSKNTLKGKVKVNNVLNNLSNNFVTDKTPLFLKETDTISTAISKASNFIGESIPVVTEEGVLIGVITEADLFSEYLEVQDKISEIERD